MNKKGMPTESMTGAIMKGGIRIDENEMRQLPEANYWKMGALWAKGEIYRLSEGKEDKVEKLLNKFFTEENSWMVICLKAEHALDLLNTLRRKECQ